MIDLKEILVVFAGPTGVGKTEIGIEFALRNNAEIVSADSIQIYKQLNIGTAKPSVYEQKLIPHHLISCWDAEIPFNLSEYINLADKTIKEIRNRNKNIIIVGGTGLYIEGLLKGIFTQPSKSMKIRNDLQNRFLNEGNTVLYNELKSIDPEISSKISPSDNIRVMRALEVFFVTGIPMSKWQKESRLKGDKYRYKLFIIDRNREELYERINQRVDVMFNNGFVEEVKMLINNNLTNINQSMKALGYREIYEAIMNNYNLEITKEKIKKATRNYAKRQLTWFRNRLSGHIINISNKTNEIILDEIEKLLEMNL